MHDREFRFAVMAGGVVLVAVITYVRFCGSLSLPDKPPPPSGPKGTTTQLLTKSAASPAVYLGFLEKDAANAGTHAPTIEEMGRKLVYRVDESHHVLEPGKPAIEAAGLRLHAERSGDDVVLVARSLLGTDAAYEVSTTVTPGGAMCNGARPLPFNAMVIAKGATETRTECVWHDGSAITVSRIETLELPPLMAWYVGQVPPKLVGVDDRVARGHRGIDAKDKCTAVMSAVVRSGMERGEIGWRDLVDFYARHRCQSYQFPAIYRAFKTDSEHPLPAVERAM